MVVVEVHFMLNFVLMHTAPDSLNFGNHVTYQSRMENDYAFPELADMHLVVTECNGNDTDAVSIYKENDKCESTKLLHFLSVDH
jgi:hypothetical protein